MNTVEAPSRWCRAEIKKFDSRHGFGFLQVAEDPRDVFVRLAIMRRAGIRHPREGQVIECRYGETAQGLAASEVRHVRVR